MSHYPKRIAIPGCLRMYNEICRYPDDDWKIRPSYRQLIRTAGRLSDRIGCKSCERHCPQRLSIA